MSDQTTLDILNAHRTRRPELAYHLDFYIAILKARGQVAIDGWKVEMADAEARLARGEPLVRVDELAYDWNLVAQLARQICAIVAQHRPEMAEAFTALAREFELPSHTQELARDYFLRKTHRGSLETFIFTHALYPWLAAAAHQLKSRVSNAATWQRGICPLCGGDPDFAALERDGGVWRLLCARCDFEWTFSRARCPFCGAEPIAYFPSKDGAYRLYTCDHCKRYLKTVDLRELAREVILPAERILTIEMDHIGLQAGYH